ncbi:uncharacterized protein DFL_009912 [Arthrobotrys flagrans]|uniref:Uncharacterized protein n=1 Tax=Arthrobotrys flagrans TaxID=97331 RepID=A0A436ZT19_ARTFL|nr:hypothetical protein DFL_009912 [Arthrobotrys flagrans]
MAIIRAKLRTERYDKSGDVISSLAASGLDADSPNQHPLINNPKLLHGHELDLFTMQDHGISGVFVSMTGTANFSEEDDWFINLTATDTQGGVDVYKVNMQYGKGASTAYKVPRGPQQFESILGLWALTLTRSNASALELENSTVEALAEGSEKAQLGSKEDAYLCILTVLLHLHLLPSPDDIVNAVLNDLSAQNIHFRLVEVKDLLLSTLKYSDIVGGQKEATLAALGELYTTSARESNLALSHFGFEELVELLRLHSTSQVAHEYG